LNAVLKIKEGIVDLHYDNTVRPGRSDDDRTTIFDLYCTLGNGKRILIEMQLEPQGFFKPRIVYYASRMIQEQGEGNKGDEWGYNLKAVYSVNIVNFALDRKKSKATDRYASYVQLMDKKTHRIFYKELTLVFLELPRFKKEVHEISNRVEEWMFVLKNLARLNDLPDKLRTRIFESLFHKAEIAKLSKEDRKKYDKSVKNLLDMNALIAEKNREIATLSQNNAALSQNNVALSQNNAALQKEITELRRRFGV
jgi:predicted transposase/invertase (TIGR01784 family)